MLEDPGGESVSALIARLIAAARPEERDRLLVEAVHSFAGCEAAWLWRVELGAESGGTWRPILGRGRLGALPSEEGIRAALASGERPALASGRYLLTAGSGDGALALALAGPTLEEDSIDLGEALLWVVHSALAADASPGPAVHLDEPAPPLPQQERRGSALGPLRRIWSSLFGSRRVPRGTEPSEAHDDA